MSHIRLFRHYIPSPLLVVSLVELAVFAVSVPLALALRFGVDTELLHDPLLGPHILVYSMVMMSCTAAMGLYHTGLSDGLGAMAVRSLVSYCLLGCAMLTILYYVVPPLRVGRGVLVYAIAISAVGLTPIRLLFFRLIDREALKTRILILGVGQRAREMMENFAESHRGVAKVKACVRARDEADVLVKGPVLEHNKPLLAIAKANNVSEIVVALDERRSHDGGAFPLDELYECKLNGVRVSDVITVCERELGFLALNEIRPSWLVFSSGFTSYWLWGALKRVTDIFVSLVLLIVTWPLLILGGVAVFLESGGPIVYWQTRVGANNKPFEMLKLRSMTNDAEKDGKAVWAQANDARITRVGAFLRNTRIDELPQLWNVLKGEMSFVGPRPERPQFVEELAQQIPYYAERHRVKPGLMGWAQLNYPYGASTEDAAKKLRYDLYYVKNRSLLLDMIIIVQTVQIILLGSGVR